MVLTTWCSAGGEEAHGAAHPPQADPPLLRRAGRGRHAAGPQVGLRPHCQPEVLTMPSGALPLFVQPPIRFIPESRTYSVPLFLFL